MNVELNLDYIKLLMKEILGATNKTSADRKAQMVLAHISQAEKDHLKAMDELEKDMGYKHACIGDMLNEDEDMLREAQDYKDSVDGKGKHV